MNSRPRSKVISQLSISKEKGVLFSPPQIQPLDIIKICSKRKILSAQWRRERLFPSFTSPSSTTHFIFSLPQPPLDTKRPLPEEERSANDFCLLGTDCGHCFTSPTWRRDCHFCVFIRATRGTSRLQGKRQYPVLHFFFFFFFFKNLSTGSAPGLEPETFRSAK